MPLPEKLKRKLLTPKKLKTQTADAISDTDGDGRTNRGNNICPFLHEWWGHKHPYYVCKCILKGKRNVG